MPWFDSLGLKPSEAKSDGMEELREVLGRLSSQAGLGHTPEQIGHIANHLYTGNMYIPGSPYNHESPEVSKENWQALGTIGDHEVELPQGGEVFGRPAEEIRHKMWEGWTGPGWTEQEERALGREKLPYELSPGDRVAHQRLRDRQYLNDILDREKIAEVPKSVSAWGGGTEPSQQDQAQKKIDEALYWYRRGDGAKNSQERYWSPVGNANFKRYTTDDASATYFVNPESTLGWLNTQVFSPTEDFANQVTMTAAEGNDAGSYVPVVTPAVDFFKNLWQHGGQALRDSMGDKPRAAQFMNHSPRVPSYAQNTPEGRIRAIRDLQRAYEKSGNISGDDYYRQKTGELPSQLGSFATTVGSSLLDPTIPLSAGVSLLRNGKAAFTLGNLLKGTKGELLQEGAENVGVMGGLGGLMPAEDQKESQSNWDYWKNAGKNAMKLMDQKESKESNSEFHKRMQEQEQSQQNARQLLRKANKATHEGETHPAANPNAGWSGN
jgi:hypothetical protein